MKAYAISLTGIIKIYVVKIYKNGKDTTETLGKEPQLTLEIANK